MPSLVIDTAAAAAQEEITVAISNINNNLISNKKEQAPKLASTSSRRHQDYSSPLFRDEVVQQEMRYFDQVLRADNGVGGCGYNLPAYKPSFGAEKVVVEKSNNNIPQKPSHYSPNRRSDTSSFPTSHHRRQAKQSTRHVRSRNIRQQTNRRLIQKAKLSSRRVMRKLAGIGKSCSKKLDLVANAIYQKVIVAMASMTSLLENGVAASHPRRSVGQEVSQHQRESATSNNSVQTDGDNSRGTQPVAPPPISFTGASSWIRNRTQRISAKAVAKAKDSIRNRNVSFIV